MRDTAYWLCSPRRAWTSKGCGPEGNRPDQFGGSGPAAERAERGAALRDAHHLRTADRRLGRPLASVAQWQSASMVRKRSRVQSSVEAPRAKRAGAVSEGLISGRGEQQARRFRGSEALPRHLVRHRHMLEIAGRWFMFQWNVGAWPRRAPSAMSADPRKSCSCSSAGRAAVL